MNPLRFFRDRATRQEEAAHAVALFQERLHHALLSRSRKERKRFSKALQQQIWEPKLLLELSAQAKENRSVFLKSQCAFAREHKIKTLQQVGAQSVFFQLLGVARDLHGRDIDHLISFRSAAEVVMEEVLLHK